MNQAQESTFKWPRQVMYSQREQTISVPYKMFSQCVGFFIWMSLAEFWSVLGGNVKSFTLTHWSTGSFVLFLTGIVPFLISLWPWHYCKRLTGHRALSRGDRGHSGTRSPQPRRSALRRPWRRHQKCWVPKRSYDSQALKELALGWRNSSDFST